MTERSFFWTTGTSGDGASTYTQADMHRAMKVLAACIGHEGIAPNYLNELVGSVLGANSIRISSGGGLSDGGIYENDGNLNFAIASAGAGETRIDRVVLRCSWASYQVRVTVITGTSAVGPTAPSIVQTSGTTYDIMLYQVLVDAAGTCTLTDERVFANVTPARTANRTRTFLVQPEVDCLNARGAQLGDGADLTLYGFFQLPSDWASGGTVAAILIPAATGNAYISNTIAHGAVGEAYNAHTDTAAISATGVTNAVIASVKSVTLTNVSQSDYYFCAFRRDATNAADTVNADCYLVGWLVSYTADS